MLFSIFEDCSFSNFCFFVFEDYRFCKTAVSVFSFYINLNVLLCLLHWIFFAKKTFCLGFLFNRYQYVYVLNFEQTQYMENLFTGTVLNEMHCSTDLHCFKVLIF